MDVKAKLLSLKNSLTISKAYKTTFNNDNAKQVLYDIVRDSGLFKVVTVANDPVQSAFNDGKRAVVIRILNILDINEVNLVEQIREIEKGVSDE